MKNTRPADIYLRFLHLAEAIRQVSALPSLDPLEERILGYIARAEPVEAQLCVREVMALETLGSPATIHSRLKSMRAKGWLRLADTCDRRRKEVRLTPAALGYFDRLSRCMLNAVTADPAAAC
jgi:DNA-binding MarR family transcriptional regulator